MAENKSALKGKATKNSRIRTVISTLLVIAGALYLIPSGEYSYAGIGAILFFLAYIVSNSFEAGFNKDKIKLSEAKRIILGVSMFIAPIVISTLFSIDDLESPGFLLVVIVSDLIILSLALPNKTKNVSRIQKQSKQENGTTKPSVNENNSKKESDTTRVKSEKITEDKKATMVAFRKIDSSVLVSIATMLTDHKIIFDKEEYLPKIDIAKLISEVYSDVRAVRTEDQLGQLLNAEYFKEKYTEHFRPYRRFFRSRYGKAQVNAAVNKNRLENVYSLVTESYREKAVKYFFGNNKAADWNGKSRDGSEYLTGMNYIYDTMTMVASIGLLCFVNNRVESLKQNSELIKITTSMHKAVPDFKVIVEKLFPLYEEFYFNELKITSKYLFQVALAAILEKQEEEINHKKSLDILDSIGSDDKIVDKAGLDEAIKNWSNAVTDAYHDVAELEWLFATKIVNLTGKTDLDTLLYGLQNMRYYIDEFRKLTITKNKIRDKERYLSGDFSEEVKNIETELSLDHISNGTQFELYLERLFRRLGYRVKHLGKSGDQGADLLASYKDKVYAIQAKFYTDTLGNTPIQEVVGSLKYYGATQGVVVTNSAFTRGAKELAKANNVILINGKKLKEIVGVVFEEDIGDVIARSK